MSSGQGLCLILADSHEAGRKSMVSILEEAPEVDRVIEAVDCTELLRMAEEAQPDLVLADIDLVGRGKLSAVPDLARSAPHTRLIILSPWRDSPYLTQCLRDGAKGYVLKSRAFEDLLAAIRVAMIDRIYISPGVDRPFRWGKG